MMAAPYPNAALTSIPLARERIGTDEQSALEAYPHVLEPVQE